MLSVARSTCQQPKAAVRPLHGGPRVLPFSGVWRMSRIALLLGIVAALAGTAFVGYKVSRPASPDPQTLPSERIIAKRPSQYWCEQRSKHYHIEQR